MSHSIHTNFVQGPFTIMSPAELDTLVPEISISTFLQKQAPAGYTITKVNVYTTSYFKSLASILKSSDRQTLHDYFQWGLTRALLDGLHKDFLTPLLEFKKKKGSKEAAEATLERWRVCLSEIDTELGWIESAFFVQRAFGKEGKDLGERIVGDIKDVYLEKLKSPSWMSDVAKTAAVTKSKPTISSNIRPN
jgi:endothelin-converting enzyme